MITFNEIFFNLITFNNCSLMSFCLKRMLNIFLPYSYCTTKFVYVVIPSIIVETTFFVSVTSASGVAALIFTSRGSNMEKIDTLTLPLSEIKSLNFHFQWEFIFNFFLRIRQIILSLLAANNLDVEHKLALIFHTESNCLYSY